MANRRLNIIRENSGVNNEITDNNDGETSNNTAPAGTSSALIPPYITRNIASNTLRKEPKSIKGKLFGRRIYDFSHLPHFGMGLCVGVVGSYIMKEMLPLNSLFAYGGSLVSALIFTLSAVWIHATSHGAEIKNLEDITLDDFKKALVPRITGARDNKPKRMRIMTFNTEGGGSLRGAGVEEQRRLIDLANADIVGLQETRLEGEDEDDPNGSMPIGASVAPALARCLEYFCYEQPLPHNHGACWSNAIISKVPISLPCLDGLGVLAELEGNVTVYVLNIHLTDYPYQPFQLMQIPYGDAPFLEKEEEAIESAKAARGKALAMIDEALDNLPARADCVVIMGDFNEPSHLDWTKRAAADGSKPMKVEWPFSKALQQRGFIDAYRNKYPDEMLNPGHTYDVYSEDSSTDERIDFIYYRAEEGVKCKVIDCQLLDMYTNNNNMKESPDVIYIPGMYPSDHRGIVVELEIQTMSFLQHSAITIKNKLERTLHRERGITLKPFIMCLYLYFISLFDYLLLSPSLSLYCFLSLCHTYILSLSLSHTHTHTHIFSLYLSLFPLSL